MKKFIGWLLIPVWAFSSLARADYSEHPDAAEFIDAARTAIGHGEKGDLVAKGVLPVVVGVDQILVFVDKPLARNLGHVRPADRDNLTG